MQVAFAAPSRKEFLRVRVLEWSILRMQEAFLVWVFARVSLCPYFLVCWVFLWEWSSRGKFSILGKIYTGINAAKRAKRCLSHPWHSILRNQNQNQDDESGERGLPLRQRAC